MAPSISDTMDSISESHSTDSESIPIRKKKNPTKKTTGTIGSTSFTNVKKFLEDSYSKLVVSTIPIGDIQNIMLPVPVNRDILLQSIDHELKEVEALDNLTLNKRLHIGKVLINVKKTYKNKKEFYDHMNNTYKMAKSTVCHLIQTCQFLSFYRKFCQTSLSITQLKTYMSSLQKWFQSEECAEIDSTNFLSDKFWRE